MADAKEVLKTIKEKEVRYVDLRFTDPQWMSRSSTKKCSPMA